MQKNPKNNVEIVVYEKVFIYKNKVSMRTALKLKQSILLWYNLIQILEQQKNDAQLMPFSLQERNNKQK